jgi:hypothetical protein
MKPMSKAIAVALIQVLVVSSLGAKLLYDRRTRPSAWFLAERYDPNLPIRGRYLSLQLKLDDTRSPEEIQRKFADELRQLDHQRAQFQFAFGQFGRECGSIIVRDQKPIPIFDAGRTWDCDNLAFARATTQTGTELRLAEPVLFFLADTAKDPTRLIPGDELWVLATIPRHGPPRPIQLGLKKKGTTEIVPLSLN